MKGRKSETTKEFEKKVKQLNKELFVFKLYVAGSSPHSLKAIKNLKQLCERYLKGHYKMDIVDIHQQAPEDENLLAAPTLVKKLPLPVRRLIGDMSDTAKVLLALNIQKPVESTV